MKARHSILVALAVTVTLTSVAAAGPEKAARPRRLSPATGGAAVTSGLFVQSHAAFAVSLNSA